MDSGVGYSQILQSYVCNLISGDRVLITGVGSELLLLSIVIYHTNGGESFIYTT